MGTSTEILRLVAAVEVRWQPYTVFKPGNGMDGRLYAADESVSIPLDIFTQEEAEELSVEELTDDCGAAFAAPATIEEAQTAIRSWCQKHLGRTDIIFD